MTPNASRRLRRRTVAAMRDPWVLLSAAVGGGLAWAVGIPAALDVGTGVVMLASAAGISAFVGHDDGLSSDEEDAPLLRLRSGTRQAQLVTALEGYLADLRKLHDTKLPEAVTNSAIEALVAADGARHAARRVASSVDALDEAIERAARVAGTVADTGGTGDSAGSVAQVRASQQRMEDRRDALLVRLGNAVGEVAEVYTKLLELSATIDTLDLSGGDGTVEDVNKSLDGLRDAFAEMETEARSARGLT